MKNAFTEEHNTKKALAEFILTAPRLSMDVKCREFERAFAGYQERHDAILFNSGGSANLAMLQTLKNLGRLKEGDRVGFSALTWSTNVMPIIQMGMVPVALDCKPTTLNVMADNLAATLTHTPLKAVFITNVLGFAGDLARLRNLCASENIVLLEDNCEALDTRLFEGKTGNFGLASSFSFFVAHHMSTVEGGMVCTDDPEVSEMLRIVRANGWDRNLNANQQHALRKQHGIASEFEAKYTFYDLGFNLRPTEITGFLGLIQLGFLPNNIHTRNRNHLQLEAELTRNPDLIPIERAHIAHLSPFAFPVLCRTPELRNRYAKQFSGAGIEIRPMIAGNIQRHPFYPKYVKHLTKVPGADFVHACGFYCGNYPELSEMDLETIRSCLRQY